MKERMLPASTNCEHKDRHPVQIKFRIPLSPKILAWLAAVGAVVGVGIDGRVDAADIRALSIGLLVISLGWAAVKTLHTPAYVHYERGYEHGDADGFSRGRQTVRPTVVSMGKRCCGNCQRTLSAATENVATLGNLATAGRETGPVPVVDDLGPVDSAPWRGGNG